MANVRKPPVSDLLTDWRPWAVARFQTENARDAFVCSVADAQDGGWDAEVMPDDPMGAHVRWRPGRFLALNDVAYARNGRIVVTVVRRTGVSAPGVHNARRHGRMTPL
jgi:hypothetical protein